jgi:ZIP family zinc transporter
MKREELGFILVIAAGMSTCLGAAAVYNSYLIQLSNRKILGCALGLSGGVMLYVSFIEIFIKSVHGFQDAGISERRAYLFATLCFFGGIFIMKLIDRLVHYLDPYDISHGDFEFEVIENPPDEITAIKPSDDCVDKLIHEELEKIGDVELGQVPAEHQTVMSQQSEMSQIAKLTMTETEEKCDEHSFNRNEMGLDEIVLVTDHLTPHIEHHHHHEHGRRKITKKELHERLNHMGMMTALAIGLHNFPEGLATFVATINDPTVGAALAVAIAIHNIPEGLCVAIPIYYASEDRHKAFLLAFISGISEVLGAFLGWIILSDIFDNVVYGTLFGLVAGMMVNICIYQLIPTAHRYDPQDIYVSNSIVVGMMIMAISLVAFMY